MHYNRLLATRLPLGCHSVATRLPLGCQVQATPRQKTSEALLAVCAVCSTFAIAVRPLRLAPEEPGRFIADHAGVLDFDGLRPLRRELRRRYQPRLPWLAFELRPDLV